MKYDLSVIIPSRNEMFLAGTIKNILKNKRAKTEIIVVLDGEWANPGIEQHPDVKVIKTGKSIGQRRATNLGVKLSRATWIMKIDAHCTWDEGCDAKMIAKMKDNYTMVPVMRNLWMFDWKCYKCGWKKYQGPTPEKCPDCGRTDSIHRKMMWVGKERPQSVSYCFDSAPHFQYFKEYRKRKEFKEMKEKEGLTETMSLQGSCFMSTRKKYWELELCGENLGSWGNQGIEVALKTWLSGGRVVVNHDTWYAHMFRTQGGDFGFPWPNSGNDTSRTKKRVKNLFWKGGFKQQKKPLSFLIEKFWPISGWEQKDLDKLKKQEK